MHLYFPDTCYVPRTFHSSLFDHSNIWWAAQRTELQFFHTVYLYGGFGGLEVECWPLVPKFAGSNPAEAFGSFGRKNPQHAFLRGGSKAVCPMSCFTACKRTQKWRESRHCRQNFSAISRPLFHLPLLGSIASLQTLEASCGESWKALNPWFSSKLGVRRAAVTPSCWECSTTVEQVETQPGL
jgi:hypothetical protein